MEWGQGRCTRPFAVTVERNAKFLFSLLKDAPYTAMIASRSTGSRATRLAATNFFARRLFFAGKLFFSETY